jgi:hypothetical protein
MKKIIYFFTALMIVTFFCSSDLNAKPIFIKLRLGIFAKWSITFNGDCEDGKGLCLAFGGKTTNPEIGPNFFGYDEETNKFYLKISKQWENAKLFSEGTFDIVEDSPVDPKLIENFSNFRIKGKSVFIKKGIYKISDQGDCYLLAADYYLQ